MVLTFGEPKKKEGNSCFHTFSEDDWRRHFYGVRLHVLTRDASNKNKETRNKLMQNFQSTPSKTKDQCIVNEVVFSLQTHT